MAASATIIMEESAQQPLRSPFFYTPPVAAVNDLAILHLKRDSLLPVTLNATADDGYAEGAVTNTRFGSFPHSTLIGLEWGSQVRASRVDTGSRGRKGKKGKPTVEEKGDSQRKRKSDELNEGSNPEPEDSKRRKADDTRAASVGAHITNGSNGVPAAARVAIEAGSGFVHLLPPTPEAWTASLDHRTQVVYTPDYSYILHRLRVRPGDHIIEAGAGSGSFTHAAARAVFSSDPNEQLAAEGTARGTVYSYEYHAPRVETLRQELRDHGLDGVVNLTHRDVCEDGFLVKAAIPLSATSPNANAIFLDLPAPWQALRHLTRSQPNSPLNPDTAIHLCSFSPCIEQVTATVSYLRKAGWTEIHMVEVMNKRIDVRREQIGLHNEGLRGVNASAATVDEAVGRLREVESKLSDFHASKTNGIAAEGEGKEKKTLTKQQRLEKIKKDAEERKLYKEGNVVHRTEPEVKSHTSYLVFAILPREWTEEDEAACEHKWPIRGVETGAREEENGAAAPKENGKRTTAATPG